ncbi:putative transcription factor GRF family [Helianthus annuus]|uniref:Putative zinc finger, GRF-type n=1 Tax=Helianthus annuus TaxID=4232 RepID=A0A251SHJ0_HELAN|nr:putative transcription factor GRF family [Helianthus annuus]
MVFCNCGQDAIIVTSWTDLNPGRRFYSCPTMNPNCGRFIGCVDPPMCSRAVAIIPGLLRHRNQVDAELAKMREKNRLKNNIITGLLILLGFVFWMYVKG